jgi:hypothetical protein
MRSPFLVPLLGPKQVSAPGVANKVIMNFPFCGYVKKIYLEGIPPLVSWDSDDHILLRRPLHPQPLFSVSFPFFGVEPMKQASGRAEAVITAVTICMVTTLPDSMFELVRQVWRS